MYVYRNSYPFSNIIVDFVCGHYKFLLDKVNPNKYMICCLVY